MRKTQVFRVREKNALMRLTPPEPTQSEKERIQKLSEQQLLEEFIGATQNPPPGAGGILGIGAPWDMPPPVETPEEYANRIKIGPRRDEETVRAASHDIAAAERRGDTTFAVIRKGDLHDATQHTAGHGDLQTWLILGGSCALFLLYMLFLILLPHGRDTHAPNIFVY